MIFENMFYKVAKMFKRFRLLSKTDDNLCQLLPTVATEFLSRSDMADILNNLNYDTEVDMMAAGYISPSNKMALGLNPAMAAGFSAVSSLPASTSNTQAASMASAGCDYPSFTQFDPHTERPPNTSGFDLPVFDSYALPTAAMSGLSYPQSVGQHHPIISKTDLSLATEFFSQSDIAFSASSAVAATSIANSFSDLEMHLLPKEDSKEDVKARLLQGP